MSGSLTIIDGLRGRLGRLFDAQLRPRIAVALGVVAFSLVWTLLVIAGAITDGTLRLPQPGRGLLDHYGFQACLFTAPLVLLTTYYSVSYFFRMLRDLRELLDPHADASLVRSIVKPHIDSLLLRGRWRNILWLFMFLGVAASITIFSELKQPIAFWGNDVFNATRYPCGFIAGNSFLLWLWGFVYPVGFFYALHLTISTEMIIARLKKNDVLRLNFLHVDKCGGMSKFGTLNFLVMLIYLWPFGAAYALHATHRYTYLSLIIGAVAISAAFIAQSIYGIYWVSLAINSERVRTVGPLNDSIRKAMEGRQGDYAAAMATMQYRDRVLSVSLFPYSGSVSAAVNVLRFAPTVLAFAKLISNMNSA